VAKVLFRWREPWAFARERSRRSRVGWTIRKRLAFGFALGTVIFLTALMRVAAHSAETPIPHRSVIDWVGIWLAACLSMAGLFWAIAYVPQPRTLTIREKLFQRERHSTAWDKVARWSWRETADYGVFSLLLKDGGVWEFGAPREIKLKIEESLDALGDPQANRNSGNHTNFEERRCFIEACDLARRVGSGTHDLE
jgi:hypothetical protein